MSDAPRAPPGMTLADVHRVLPGAQVIQVSPADADQPLAAGKIYLINIPGAVPDRELVRFRKQLHLAGVRAFVINTDEIQIFELDATYVERDFVVAGGHDEDTDT